MNDDPLPGRPARLWYLVLAIAAAALALWLAVPEARSIVGSLLAPLPPIGVFAGIHLYRPARRRAWLAFGLGGVAIAAGVVLFIAIPLSGGTLSQPSIADGLIVAGLTLELVALIVIVRARGSLGRWDLVDGSVLVIAFGLFAWFFIFDPAFEMGTVPAAEIGVLVYYLIANAAFLLLGFSLVTTPGNRQTSFWLVLAALASVMASQVLFSVSVVRGTYVPGGLGDLGWAAGQALWALAALHPTMVRLTESAPASRGHRVPVGRFVAIVLATLTAPAALILIGEANDELDLPVIALAAGGMFALVAIRLFHAGWQLSRSLDVRDRLELELREQALRDGLTGLANRAMFTRQLEAALRADPGGVAVLYCDLDDFKAVNDTLGHEAGDELLVETGRRLRAAVRPSDLPARLGGDEFGVLLRGASSAAEVVAVAERILEVGRKPIEISGQVVYAGPSIGIAFGEDGADGAAVLRNADIAMYLAKSQGKNQYELFRPSLHAEVVSRLALRASLRHALEVGEFVVHYQPIVELETERVVAFEALVRWDHPERGLIPPAEFIPVAEATGLIVPLGEWVLRTAIAQLAEWTAAGVVAPTISVTVNLSPAQLRDPDIIEAIGAALAAGRLAPDRLILEVTEGVVVDLEGAFERLEGIRALGVHVAIDDFGTGYSALSYLSRFPIDHLKIDRSFISALGISAKETTLTETVVKMATKLQLATVAEGIETHEQLEMLRALGCRYGQGYLFSRPVDAGAIEAFMRDAAEAASGPAGGGPARRVRRAARAGRSRVAASPT